MTDSISGKAVKLEPLQYVMLKYLADAAGEFVSSGDLLETRAAAGGGGNLEGLRPAITKLRTKIRELPVTIDWKSRFGYRLIRSSEGPHKSGPRLRGLSENRPADSEHLEAGLPK